MNLEHLFEDLILKVYNCPDCSIIIVHPKTWEDLVIFSRSVYSAKISPYSPNPIFSGIKVYRTQDINEGQFEIK